MSREYNLTWRGREVQSPAARWCVIPLALLLIAVFLPLWIAVLIGSIPLHFVTKLVNGRGFIKRSGRYGEKVNYDVPGWACILVLAGIVALIVL